MTPILLIQGANMEFLGHRDPAIYGSTTAAELDAMLHAAAPDYGLNLDIRYTNIEGEAIGWIYEGHRRGIGGLIVNPAGFHYAGYALRDCLAARAAPYVEVHMSNLDARGKHSVTACEADALVAGLGTGSYLLGLKAMRLLLDRRDG